MNGDIYPLRFHPVYKDYLWGGNRIARLLHRPVTLPVCAESWEIADRPEGMSIVCNGPLSGASLHHLVATMGSRLTGTSSAGPAFPLLIKIIDARQRLSVQVHPDGKTAALCGGEPKTEMWYVLDGTAQGARLFAGLAPHVDEAAFRKALEAHRLEDVLQSLPARAGDAFYIPGGRVHAIAEGCFLLEVQQNSNTTYRVYDWGRVGEDGRPRELHLAEAFRVIAWGDQGTCARVPPGGHRDVAGNAHREIVASPFFRVERLDLTAPETIENDGRSFHALFAAREALSVMAPTHNEVLPAGSSCLIPAALPRYRVAPVGPAASVIRITLA